MSDQIRRAVNQSALSRYAMCKAAKIDQATFSRFMHGVVGLSMATLDDLADVLGLDLAPLPDKPKASKTKGR
ncbi:MAG: helix-turn-helix transcriptional regulator [Planctomycetaceae bacterium]|nr:helix-turn-helix transcriptional regulator [Planctomycetaceae bacterium]